MNKVHPIGEALSSPRRLATGGVSTGLRFASVGTVVCLLLSAAWARPQMTSLTLPAYMDKVLGGWAGQMIGVSYGSVYEFTAAGFIYDGPIRDWEPSFVTNALGQDDLYVEMTFLRALQEHGLNISDEQAGRAFAASRYGLAHANATGRENCRRGIMPPLSGHPNYNPHADDIDFQIEADVFGLITPGMPAAMTCLCDRFGHIMNYGDGVYGGMFIAGTYSAAFFEREVEKVLEQGLRCIPAESKYARLISDVLAYHRRKPEDWRGCWGMLEEKWAPQDLCPDGRGQPFNIDAKLNGGYVALALLYGGGDFQSTLELAVRCGQDSDCNASSAGGVLGTLLGYAGIPEAFRAGLPAIADQKFAFTEYSFNMLGEACAGLARRIIEANGGRIERTAAGEVWHVRRQAPRPPAKLEQWVDVDHDLQPRALPGIEGKRGVRVSWRPLARVARYRLFRSLAPEELGETIFSSRQAASWEDSGAPVGRLLSYTLEVRMADGLRSRSRPMKSFVLAGGPLNEPSDVNLARQPWAFPDAAVDRPTGSGLKDLRVIADGITANQNYDSFDGVNPSQEDWYAIFFARRTRVNELQYVEGNNFHDGGWWLSLTAQYLDPQSFTWRDCRNVQISPAYDFRDTQEGRVPCSRFKLTFEPVVCAGVRICGRPGGSAAFTSIAELEVYYR